MSTPLVVGNWKMHGVRSDCLALARQVSRALRGKRQKVEVVIAPPFTALALVKTAIGKSNIGLAGQNCHWGDSGAYTGEISPAMLRDVGCNYVILGHSERRHLFQESDSLIAKKVLGALSQGLRVILCVGETSGQRRAGQTVKVISRQLRVALKGVIKTAIDRLDIAYEPVWAIGTGHNATPEQISKVHVNIRRILTGLLGGKQGSEIRILYGGSVNPGNAISLTGAAQVSGLLVGGASLNPDAFMTIVGCYSAKQG